MVQRPSFGKDKGPEPKNNRTVNLEEVESTPGFQFKLLSEFLGKSDLPSLCDLRASNDDSFNIFALQGSFNGPFRMKYKTCQNPT